MTLAIVFGLLALLFPIIGLVQIKASVASARHSVEAISIALDAYRQDDPQFRYPPPQSDLALTRKATAHGGTAVLTLLECRGIRTRFARVDAQQRMIDPWGRPYRYTLTRPVVRDPVSLACWNYDPQRERERTWRSFIDIESGTLMEGPSPFPYVYSLGRSGSDQIASDWILRNDQQ